MKKYPHRLDEETLPERLEREQAKVVEDEAEIEEAVKNKRAIFVKALGEEYYSVGVYGYALDEAPAKVKTALSKSLEYHFSAFRMGVVTDVYEFLTILSLAVVLGETEIAESAAAARRDRYTNPNIEAEEIVFIVAELLSAFVRKDETAIGKILAANNPDEIDSNKIYKYDRMIFFPLLRLMAAIHRRDDANFTALLKARNDDFAKFYARVNDKNMPEALIDMPGLAVAALAKERGINFTDTSVYRPSELITRS